MRSKRMLSFLGSKNTNLKLEIVNNTGFAVFLAASSMVTKGLCSRGFDQQGEEQCWVCCGHRPYGRGRFGPIPQWPVGGVIVEGVGVVQLPLRGTDADRIGPNRLTSPDTVGISTSSGPVHALQTLHAGQAAP